MKNKKVIVFGGDGFCGWPTSLLLAKEGFEVLIVDNLSRRDIDKKYNIPSLVKIASIEQRVERANELIGDISFLNIDVTDDAELRQCIKEFMPNVVVHFAEQRSAPFSMISDVERRYTINNNTQGTHNILSAIVDINQKIEMIHLGTMGVYGYSDDLGPIPEGYLDVIIKETGKEVTIPYPANPGSVYHLTKCIDHLIFQYYHDNWGIEITDLHQGVVWGIQTDLTGLHPDLNNRFDYDGIYGTVLNRFIMQASNDHPLTVYGTGGQKRAFINISDTARCVYLAISSPSVKDSGVRVFNQISEIKTVLELAEMVSSMYDVKIDYIENPRNERFQNELEVSNQGLKNIGFNPIYLNKGLIKDIHDLSLSLTDSFDSSIVLNSPKWK